MVKMWIADTNVLLNNPEVLDEYDIIIPSHVNREIEHLELTRKQDRTLQWQIRRFKKKCDENNNAYINLKDYEFKLDDELDPQYTDNILLQVAHDEGYGIITNDRLLRRKCRQFGIPFLNVESKNYIENKGFKEIYMTEDELKKVHLNLGINQFDLMSNEYIIINNDIDGELLDIMKWNGEHLISLRDKKGKLGRGFKTAQFGEFTPRDEQQIMAVDSIFSNQLTSIRGRAGSGKSLLTLSTAWYLVEREKYKLVIFVNPTPLRDSQELGFYKGDRLEKLMQSAVGTMLKAKFGDEIGILREIQDGKLDILPFVDLRGWDSGGDKCIVWILEAQNLTSDLMKLGLQRITESTKVVVDGDYDSQIDRDSYASDNGMKRMSEVFRGTDLFGEVELQQVHRSRLADLADKM
jgi:predicted ribonuclease YlaK